MYGLRLLVGNGTVAQESAADIELCLRVAGFRVSHVERDEKICVAIFSSSEDIEFWFSLGEVCGKGREVLIITDRESRVPQAAQRLPIIRSLGSVGVNQELLRAVSEIFGFQDVSAPEDPEQLAHWVAKDEERLGRLSQQQLSTLCRWLVSSAGYETFQPTWAKVNDLMVRDPSTSSRFLIQWEAAPTKTSMVELGDICEFHRRSSTAEVDYSVIVTNGKFSSSALRWSSECMPAMRLLDQNDVLNNIRRFLKVRVEAGHGNTWVSAIAGEGEVEIKADSAKPNVPEKPTRFILEQAAAERLGFVGNLSFRRTDANVEEAWHDEVGLRMLAKEGGGGYRGPCLMIHSGKYDRDLVEIVGARLHRARVRCFDIGISDASSVQRLREFKSKAMIWIIAPGLFSKERSRYDGMALSQAAHLFNEFAHEKPVVIFLTSGRAADRQRVPTCLEAAALWCPWESFDWESVAQKAFAKVSVAGLQNPLKGIDSKKAR